MREFSEEIDPTRVEYVHCGVHPEERERRKGWASPLANLEILVGAGFPVFASCVMTPAAFGLFESTRELLRAIDVTLIPKILRGMDHGRRYPQSYTLEERDAFVRLSERADSDIEKNPQRPMRNRPTINPLLDRHFLDGVPDFTGVQCSAGRNWVIIDPDGNLYECGAHGWMGNIFHGRIRFLTSDHPCRSEWRHYACVRYSAIDETGVRYLPLAPAVPSMRMRAEDLVHKIEHGVVNRLIQLSLR